MNACGVQVVAHPAHDVVPQPEALAASRDGGDRGSDSLRRFASFDLRGVVDGKRRRPRGVQDAELAPPRSRSSPVGRSGFTVSAGRAPDGAAHRDHVLEPQLATPAHAPPGLSDGIAHDLHDARRGRGRRGRRCRRGRDARAPIRRRPPRVRCPLRGGHLRGPSDATRQPTSPANRSRHLPPCERVSVAERSGPLQIALVCQMPTHIAQSCRHAWRSFQWWRPGI